MGNCVGAASPEDREAKSRSSAIDRQLREDKKEYENTIKILLLGKSVSRDVPRRKRANVVFCYMYL